MTRPVTAVRWAPLLAALALLLGPVPAWWRGGGALTVPLGRANTSQIAHVLVSIAAPAGADGVRTGQPRRAPLSTTEGGRGGLSHSTAVWGRGWLLNRSARWRD